MHRSKNEAFEWILRHVEDPYGILSLCPQNDAEWFIMRKLGLKSGAEYLAYRLGWTQSRTEKFLTDCEKPTNVPHDEFKDMIPYLIPRMPKVTTEFLEAWIREFREADAKTTSLWLLPVECQSAARQGIRLLKIDTHSNVWYVVRYGIYEYWQRCERRWRKQRRWDRKHRPSGHAEALRRHPKPTRQPPIQPDPPQWYTPLDRRCPNKARFGNKNAQKKTPSVTIAGKTHKPQLP